MRRRGAISGLAVVVLLATTAACGDDRDGRAAANAPVTTHPSSPSTEITGSTDVTETSGVATSEPIAHSADGVLTIGTLLPSTGPGNEIGIAGLNAVNVGVTTINDEGGVLGNPVRLFNASEGVTPDETRAGTTMLLDNNVDAIIGPASSLVALEVLDELMAAGVVVCSPTATALSLNDYPNRDLFFRTIPSDSLSAQAMAVFAANTGVLSYAVVYLDDQFGRPFAQAAINRLARDDDLTIHDRPFASDATPEQLAALATELAELAPRTVLLVADSEHGWAMLQAMSEVFATDPPDIFVNDALRDPPSNSVVADLPAEFREAIHGVSPGVPPATSPEPVGAFATNSVDCLNLIALAAVTAGTDDPVEIADEMVDLTVAGSLCNSFAQCRNIAEQDRTINYQGANSIDLSERGDPTRGPFGTFSFDTTGLAIPGSGGTITELDE